MRGEGPVEEGARASWFCVCVCVCVCVREGGREGMGEWVGAFFPSCEPRVCSLCRNRKNKGREGGKEGGRAYQAQNVFSVDSLVLLLYHPLSNAGQFVLAGKEAPVHDFFDQAHLAWSEGREGGREGGRTGYVSMLKMTRRKHDARPFPSLPPSLPPSLTCD
jgi:hypothetical protein